MFGSIYTTFLEGIIYLFYGPKGRQRYVQPGVLLLMSTAVYLFVVIAIEYVSSEPKKPGPEPDLRFLKRLPHNLGTDLIRISS